MRGSKRRARRRRRATIGAVMGALAGVASAVFAVRRRRAGADAEPQAHESTTAAPPTDTAVPPPAGGPAAAADGEDAQAAPSAAPHTFACTCGQEVVVQGEGRHRVFWLPDAAPEDPVMDDRCPNCDRDLRVEAEARA